MATYYISVHDLLHRLSAQDQEQPHYLTAYSNNPQLELERETRLKVVERRELDARSTSCPAITTKHCESWRSTG